MKRQDQLSLLALHAVVKEPPDYLLRRAFRWYSKTFHTPLHQVEDLPLFDVLQAFWEEHYEKMEEKDLEEAVELVLETEDARRKRILAEEEAKVNDHQFYSSPVPQKTKAKLEDAKVKEPTNENIADNMAQPPTMDVADLKELPPNISMTFVSEEEMAKIVGETDLSKLPKLEE